MVGNISTNCLTPVLLVKRMNIDYDRDVQIIARPADTPVFFMATTSNSRRKHCRSSSPTPRRIPATCAMPRPASAPISTSNRNPRKARRRPDLVQSVQGRRRGHPQGRRRRRHPCVVVNVSNPVGMIQAGRVRPLAVGGPVAAWPTCRRSASGFQGFAPRNGPRPSHQPVPREIIDKLHVAFAAAASAELQAISRRRHDLAGREGGRRRRAWLRKEMETWRRDIADAGIKVDESSRLPPPRSTSYLRKAETWMPAQGWQT